MDALAGVTIKRKVVPMLRDRGHLWRTELTMADGRTVSHYGRFLSDDDMIARAIDAGVLAAHETEVAR